MQRLPCSQKFEIAQVCSIQLGSISDLRIHFLTEIAFSRFIPDKAEETGKLTPDQPRLSIAQATFFIIGDVAGAGEKISKGRFHRIFVVF